MFTDKVAVITGAGSGIGRELAIQLAAQGARLALSDINLESVEETKGLCKAGAEIITCKLDVANRDDFFAHAEDVKRDLGGTHFVFNNAGATVVGTVAHTSIDEYEWQIGINLWGVIYGTKAFLPTMLEQGEGHIVNLSSVFGLVAFPTQSAYNITKFAVRGFTECLWRELEGTGVRAVCVHPGGIKTNIERAGRRVALAGEEEATFAKLAETMLVTPPADCARDILDGIVRGKHRILTGHRSSTMFWLARLFPNHYHKILSRVVK